MKHRIIAAVGLLTVVVVAGGCSGKEKERPAQNTTSMEIISEEEQEKVRSTEKPAEQKTIEKLKPPQTKEELEEALGKVDEQGKWTPPEGAYVDPNTGNILNKDGVVVGTTQKPYTKARPGSKG